MKGYFLYKFLSFYLSFLGVLESEDIKKFFTNFLGGPVLTFDFKVAMKSSNYTNYITRFIYTFSVLADLIVFLFDCIVVESSSKRNPYWGSCR